MCVIRYTHQQIEKFAQTAENKSTIKKKLSQYDENPLVKLEKLVDDESDFTLRQIGFCAKWSLDNYCEYIYLNVVRGDETLKLDNLAPHSSY